MADNGSSPLEQASPTNRICRPVKCGQKYCGQSSKASKTVNCSERAASVGSSARLPDFRFEQSYVCFMPAADIPFEMLTAAVCQEQTKCTAAKDLHSITLSARRRRLDGTAWPMACAVFRLITSSNRVGCSTGMSAGLAPRRTLATRRARSRNVSAQRGP